MTTTSQFLVQKDNIREGRIDTREVPPLSDGEVLARIERFALTANNVTYGVMGDRIGYWKFFPVESEGEGVIPVWGFAEIVESNYPEVPAGERIYGFFPMASHLVMQPAKVSEGRFVDGAEHRAGLPPVYNSYTRVGAEPDYDGDLDDARMVLFPLYATSFCIYDFMQDHDWYDASQVVVLSASSKTAIGCAYAISADASAPKSVGVTSPRNAASVEKLGLYDEVLTYDALDNIDASIPTVVIDMSGDGGVLGRLHEHLGDTMKYTSNVGVTHYDANIMPTGFIRERSEMFFAPGHIQKRHKEWGPGVFEKRAHDFWKDTALKSRDWLTIHREHGDDAAKQAWNAVALGKTSADEAWVVGF